MMKQNFLLIIILFVSGFGVLRAQTNIGSASAPDASAMLQVTSTAQGFRPPQVGLGSTTSFGLTTPTVAANAIGMMVYNNNALITGSSAYPAYGTGIYNWDGTGWVAPSYACPVVFVASGTTTAAVGNNALTALDLSSISVNKAQVTLTSSNTVNIVATGTYKIDLCMEAKLQTNNSTNNSGLACYIRKNGSTIDKGFISQLPITGTSNQSLSYKVSFSSIATLSAGDALIFYGLSYGMPVNTIFQMKELKIRLLK
ncbi:MAG TPA: hypothetical protein VKT28_14970 [Puia sp.]|nr:hypothetical protein [Puia sp.]